MNQEQEKPPRFERPDFMVKAEHWVTPNGSELILGYYVINMNGIQVAPSGSQIFLTYKCAYEAKDQQQCLINEMRALINRLDAPVVGNESTSHD